MTHADFGGLRENHRTYRLLVMILLFAVTAIVGPARARAANPDSEASVECKNSSGDSIPTKDVRSATEMVGLVACWDADPTNDQYRLLNDLYAQWTIVRVPLTGDFARDYAREGRPAILRLFFGKNVSFVSSVRIDLHDPDMTFVMPLAAFGYEGRVGKGESWITDVVSDDQSQPLFRIGPSTSAKIAVSAKSSNDIEVRATGTILTALRSLASIVTPGGSLITALNATSLKQASTAVDAAIGSIWSEAKDERQISSRQLSEWYERAGFLIQLDIPSYIKTGANSGQTAIPNRRWYRLRLGCPRYSIFDAAAACADSPELAPTRASQSPGYAGTKFRDAVKPMAERISTEQVLNYSLAPGKTLQQFLSDHAWYTRFLRLGDAPDPGDREATEGAKTAPPKAPPRTKNDVSSLCRSIADALYQTGLSSFDARLGLWATITGSSDFVGLRANFEKNEDCESLLPSGKEGPWRFAA